VRLGGVLFKSEDIEGLEALVPTLDRYGLSAIPAPDSIDEMSDEEVFAFGARARELGLVIGESMLRCNLMAADEGVRELHVQRTRDRLAKANVMGCVCVFIGVGSVRQSDGFNAPDPYMFGAEGMKEFADVVRRVLDTAPDGATKLAVEPTNRSFFSKPDAMAELVTMVDHPRLAVHLDLANLVSQENYFANSALIEEAFSRLSPFTVSAHLKDISWDPSFYSLKLDEVEIGKGVVDYPSYLTRLDGLDPDLTCYCEHLETEEEYARNFATLHGLAGGIGHPFVGRDAAARQL
jgi:sugar phosphate isomerase/epimerase